MGIKNTAMKFFMADEAEERGYEAPHLVKSGHLNILVRTPVAFSDVREYADALMSGCAIMVSFDAVDAALKNRIFDYLNGVSYIIGASVSKVTDDLLMYAPNQVDVDKEAAPKRSGVRSFWG
ncbi:MAG: cell division protein SepF [Phascolarctobacterium sp.]|nr:cell division protein SepF [Phascolarctobacterium sp.]MBR5486536.1 cell division protein SepF [Phascolarctobacterium sp.]MBR6511701.1 cell division protein SepF [Phascolarctobacterium sp.]